jgi:AcrR family transcriptional regulator
MGTTQRRQREATARRKAILAAGLRLFRRHGYERTTMPQIAGAAELAPGTLYLYFPSKEALYVELLTEGYQLLQARLAGQAASATPIRQRAAAMIDVFLDFARERPEYFEIIFFVLQRERTGDWEETFDREQLARVRDLEAACKTAAAEVLGQFAPGSAAQRRQTVDAVWSMLCGVVEHFGGKADFDAVARQAKEVIIAGIFSRQ